MFISGSHRVYAAILLTLLFMGEGNVSAQGVQTASAGGVEQVFTFNVAAPLTISTLPATTVVAQMTVNVEHSSLLVISFSAEGGNGTTSQVRLDLSCTIDNMPTPCEPGQVRFAYNPFVTSNTQSFTWVVPNVARGTHSISIQAGVEGIAFVTMPVRTLVIEAANLRTD